MIIAILGFGFVGQAVATSFTLGVLPRQDPSILVYDPDPQARAKADERGYRTFDDPCDMGRPDAVFVCVPTPSWPDGRCNDTALWMATAAALNMSPTVICKSTAPVSVYQQFDKHLVAYVPEFLRQASATSDYLTQKSVVIGSDCPQLTDRVKAVFDRSRIRHAEMKVVGRNAAIIGKYAHNVSLAVKVGVMNEMHTLACLQGVDWDQVVTVLDGTAAGHSHTQVPGPDGRFGFGGACFPKDLTAALVEITQAEGREGVIAPHPIMDAARHWILRN